MADHGTVSRYTYGRCRCEPCRRANSAYQRERRAHRRSHPQESGPPRQRPRVRNMPPELVAVLRELATASWVGDAACDGSKANFLPLLGEAQTSKPTETQVARWYRRAAPAVAVCGECPVRSRCLEVALATPEAHDWGVWGGTLPHERRRIRAEREAS
jgi:hypothetical protein